MIITVEELDDDLQVITGSAARIVVTEGAGLTQTAADALYAELVHTHTQADVTGLVTALAGKADDSDITALDGRVDVLEAVTPVLTINGDPPDVDGNVDVAGGTGAVDSVNGQTGVVVLDADDLADGTTNHVFTAADDTKLAGVATGATANDTDANLRARADHTGVQAISTVTGLQTALDGKAETTVTDALDGRVDTLEAVDNATQAELDAHLNDTTGAHAATAVSFSPTGGVAAITVQAAIAEVDSEKAASVHTHAESDVTSLVTDLAAKAPLASPTFTGNPLAPTPSAGDNDTSIATTAFVTAALLKQQEVLIVALSDETTAITTGTAKVTMRMPFAMTLTAVRASLTTASSSGIPTVDINEAGATILSTKLTIDASELTSTTAATAAVISDTSLADDAEITFDIDVAGTGAKGLKVTLLGTRT